MDVLELLFACYYRLWFKLDFSHVSADEFYSAFAFYRPDVSVSDRVDIMRNRGHQVRVDAVECNCPLWYGATIIRFDSTLAQLCVQSLLKAFLINLRTFDILPFLTYSDCKPWFYLCCLTLYIYDHNRKSESRKIVITDFDAVRTASVKQAIAEYLFGCIHENKQCIYIFNLKEANIFLSKDWSCAEQFLHDWKKKKLLRNKVILSLLEAPYRCFKVNID